MLIRLFSSVTAFVFISLSLLQAQKLEEGVFVYDHSNQLIREFSKDSKFVVDHKSLKGFELFGARGLKANLKSRGIKFRDLDQENFLFSKFGTQYPSFESLQDELKKLNARYPELTQLFSIGKTVEGRDLWFMQISKHAHDSTPLPEVKYISSMHGDEITGRELMMKLIADILLAYGQDSKITELVNNTRIFIMPSMNPDGSFHIRRWNGNGADLNRNFPDFSTDDNQNIFGNREPETKAVMKFQAAHHIALSANFHGGAEVVNYMWDTLSDDHPLLPLLKEISLDYASKVSYLKNSTEFQDGITNGFAWYEVNGGMQDWSYFWHNDLQFTIELSGRKYPDYQLMDQYYRDNKDALLSFLSHVHQGAGFVSDRKNLKGTVTVLKDEGIEHEKKNLGSYSFSDSYFYKVLQPGKYQFLILAVGIPETEVNIEISAEKIYPRGNFAKIPNEVR